MKTRGRLAGDATRRPQAGAAALEARALRQARRAPRWLLRTQAGFGPPVDEMAVEGETDDGGCGPSTSPLCS
jgi:hypothetical protein